MMEIFRGPTVFRRILKDGDRYIDAETGETVWEMPQRDVPRFWSKTSSKERNRKRRKAAKAAKRHARKLGG